MNWKEFLKEKRNRSELIVTLLMLAAVLISLANFLNYVEARPGVILDDPVLDLFNPVDLTWLTFALIYISIIIAFITLANNPERLLLAVQIYILMVTVRIISMFLLPLAPPEKMIILNDPLVEFFGTGQTLTKDLFFSGHTATLFIVFLTSEKKTVRLMFLVSTISVAVSVLLQHVHYTIDVLAALFFTYSCYKLLIKYKPVKK